MNSLQQYDALVLADSDEYYGIFAYLFRSEDEESKERLINDYVKIAMNMNGVFYSRKYNTIMFGLFEKQNRLNYYEFINRLKNTL